MNTAARRLFNRNGSEYMPLNLKGVLMRLGIQQREWAANVLQASGKPLSHSASTQLLNWNEWPEKTPAFSIKKQTEDFLAGHGVPPEELRDIWQIDKYDTARNQHPYGVHAAQGKAGLPLLNPDESPETREMLSPNARKHFSLFRDPFQDDITCADDLFLSADQRYVREAIYTTAKHGGFMAVVGESGAGKTVLRKDFIERIAREQQAVVVIQPRVIDKGRLNAGLIFEAIIDDLRPGEKQRRTLEGKARQAERLLQESSRAGNSHVLIIEEAHDLTIQTLKVLKRFWELEDGFKRLLAIVLIGQPELALMLDERARPEAREVIRRCEVAILAPLDANLEQYLAKKFGRLNVDVAKIIAPDAYDALRVLRGPQVKPGGVVVKASQLYPLVVNNVITKAMNLAAENGEDLVSAATVKAL